MLNDSRRLISYSAFSIHPSAFLPLPARLLQPRYVAGKSQLAEHDPAHLELPQHRAGPARELAAVVRARRARVARQLGERGVVLVLLQLPPDFGVTRHQRLATLLFTDPGF